MPTSLWRPKPDALKITPPNSPGLCALAEDRTPFMISPVVAPDHLAAWRDQGRLTLARVATPTM
eukprot:5659544-Amphidinium_carterae.1